MFRADYDLRGQELLYQYTHSVDEHNVRHKQEETIEFSYHIYSTHGLNIRNLKAQCVIIGTVYC